MWTLQRGILSDFVLSSFESQMKTWSSSLWTSARQLTCHQRRINKLKMLLPKDREQKGTAYKGGNINKCWERKDEPEEESLSRVHKGLPASLICGLPLWHKRSLLLLPTVRRAGLISTDMKEHPSRKPACSSRSNGWIALQNTTGETSFLCRTHQRTGTGEETVIPDTKSSTGQAGWGAAAALPPLGQQGKKPNSFPDQKGFTCEEQQTGQDNGLS